MSERGRNEDYAITIGDARELLPVSMMPDEYRREELRRVLSGRNQEQVIALFSAFIGLANSVVVNNRRMIEEYLILECHEYPQSAERINLPNIQGALNGIEIASPSPGMCSGCAFRLGTPANQSQITTIDAAYCVEDKQPFMCHMDGLDEKTGEPTKLCAGYGNKCSSRSIAPSG